MDPVRLSSQEGFQNSILFPVVILFGWMLLPGLVPVVVLVAIFSQEGFFFPGALARRSLRGTPGPEMVRRLLTVRRCRLHHQRS